MASAKAYSSSPHAWQEYEHSSRGYEIFRQLAKWRGAILYPFSRRFFLLPRINPLGVTLGELIILASLVGTTIGIGIAQQNTVKGSGKTAVTMMTFLFIFVLHRGPVTWFFGMPFERTIRWHFIFSVIATLCGLWHGIVEVKGAHWDWHHEFGEGFNEHISGLILLVIMILTVLSALRPVRRRFYQVWVRFHLFFTFLAVLFAIIHHAPIVLVGVAFVVIDRIYGMIYQARFKYRYMTVNANVYRMPADIVRISFPRGRFRFKAGQYMNLCIPKVSRFEWHPFSISSGPADDAVIFHIRVLGDWSRRLQQVAGELQNTNELLQVQFEGPLGNVSVNIESERYKTFVLISGGIGVTPLHSIYRDLVEQAVRGRELSRVHFIWSVRDRFLIDSVYDRCYMKNLPQELPTSFQPDNITDAVEASAARGSRAYMDIIDHTERGMGRDGADPQLIEKLSKKFHFSFHLTKPRPFDAFSEANIKPNGTYDLHFERADFLDIFEKLKAGAMASGENRIAVLTCGPDGLTRDVHRAAARASKGDVKFDVHIELFKL